MKIFDLFDQAGNKIGEAHTSDNSSDGIGCLFPLLLILVIGLGAICVWPIFIKDLFFRPNKSNLELVEESAYFLMLIGTLIARMIFDCKKEVFSFWDSWGKSVIFITLIPGFSYWILVCLLEEPSLAALFLSWLMSFFFSIGGGLVEALLVKIIRWIRTKRSDKM